MPRLTVKELRKAMDIELETVWYRLVGKIATLADRQADMAMRYDRMVDQIQQLTQLAALQAETIRDLTSKLEELAEAYDSTADEVEMLHQWADRQQQRIVALEKRELQTFALSGSNANRLELHGNWISDLFNRINEEKSE